MFSDVEAAATQTLLSLHELALLPLGLDHFIGPRLLEQLVASICDAQLVVQARFARHTQSLLLQLLLDLLRRYVYELPLDAVVRVSEASFFARHKDRREGISEHISDYILVELAQQQQVRSS
jgi:hypothetical protein